MSLRLHSQDKPTMLKLLVLSLALVGSAVAWQCPSTTCADLFSPLSEGWLNSTSMATRIRGTQLTFFPRMPNGDAFTNAFAQLGVLEVAETKLDANGDCRSGSVWTFEGILETGRVARYLNMSSACCEVSYDEAHLQGTAFRKMVIVNITRPDWPAFSMDVVLSIANETVVYTRPNTSFVPEPYNITFEYVSIPSPHDA